MNLQLKKVNNKNMALVLKPGMVGFEDSILSPTIFLAGSIEMGAAEEWQSVIEKTFENEEVTFFNPRRNDWDSSWHHNGEQFNTQVNWELNALDESDIIFMYFSPETKSPISLLELGLYADHHKMIVVCTRYSIPMFNTFEEGIFALRTAIKKNQTLY